AAPDDGAVYREPLLDQPLLALALEGAADPVGLAGLDLGHVIGDVDSHRQPLLEQSVFADPDVLRQVVDPYPRPDRGLLRIGSVRSALVSASDHDCPVLAVARPL